MPEMMKCFVMHGIGKAGVMEKPIPRPGSIDAIIRTTAALNGPRGKHDFVLRVAKGRDSTRKGFFGNMAMHMLRKCPCAVWLVSPTTTPEFVGPGLSSKAAIVRFRTYWRAVARRRPRGKAKILQYPHGTSLAWEFGTECASI